MFFKRRKDTSLETTGEAETTSVAATVGDPKYDRVVYSNPNVYKKVQESFCVLVRKDAPQSEHQARIAELIRYVITLRAIGEDEDPKIVTEVDDIYNIYSINLSMQLSGRDYNSQLYKNIVHVK